MERKPLLPDYTGSVFERWTLKYLKANFWRFSFVIGDWEDACSEATLVYYDCRQRYGGVVVNFPHFMALYKKCIYSWFTDYANFSTDVIKTENTYARQVKENITVGFDGDLALKIREGSSELQQVVKIILQSPLEVISTLSTDTQSFFSKVVVFCGLGKEKIPSLEKELLTLLTVGKPKHIPLRTKRVLSNDFVGAASVLRNLSLKNNLRYTSI